METVKGIDCSLVAAAAPWLVFVICACIVASTCSKGTPLERAA